MTFYSNINPLFLNKTMENLQNLLGNFGNWMGYPICDIIGATTDDEVEDFSKLDYDLWLCASDTMDLEKVLCLAGCLDSEV